ncbi:MAG TPA: hypothetical protein VFA89_24820 [Terriglobales bacterium]|nr:hypothetical protein [Terriglobales bacterium]
MSRVLRLALVGLMIAATLAIFFMPLPWGTAPFQATHGPVTTFRAARAASLCKLILTLAATVLLAGVSFSNLLTLADDAVNGAALRAAGYHTPSILKC